MAGIRSTSWALVAALMILSSCGRKPDHPTVSSTKTHARRESTAVAVTDAGSENLGPPIGRTDPLLNEIASRLSPWVAMWQAASPGFAVDSLRQGAVGRGLEDGYVQPSDAFKDDEARAVFTVLSSVSPGGRYRLVFDWYQEVEERNNEIMIGGEPDSAPLLIDRSRHLANQFETCGTACSFEWGCWIDSTRFVIAGSSESDVPGTRAYGFISLYSIPDSTVHNYVTQPVSLEAWTSYRNAWSGWVQAGYRAWKASHSRT